MDAKRAATAKVRDVGSFIREQRTAARMSVRHLAKLAGVSNPYLSQIERGLRVPSAQVLQAIAEGLRISAETLYVRAGILEERDDDLGERILADPWLTEPQKRALLEIYRSFRGHAPEGHGAPAPGTDAPGPDAPAPGPDAPARGADAPANPHRPRTRSPRNRTGA